MFCVCDLGIARIRSTIGSTHAVLHGQSLPNSTKLKYTAVAVHVTVLGVALHLCAAHPYTVQVFAQCQGFEQGLASIALIQSPLYFERNVALRHL